MAIREIKANVPRKLVPLLAPARYKCAWGGRGGSKSHFFAEQIVLRCVERETRVVCIREVQNSIKESVRQLIIDKIEALCLSKDFEVLETEIRGPHGSLIIFKGMQAYNAANIKSLEGYDIAWVEEAQTLSAVSLRMLRPTLRKDGSEIWFSWNPRHDTDPVDNLFRGAHPPKDAIVVEVNWRDNPWFPGVLRQEMERDFAADPEMAEHVWNGAYELVSEGAYYARMISAAEREGRIGDFPYRPGLRCLTAWDLGIDDATSIWFLQSDGVSVTAVDFFEVNGDGFDEIVKTGLPELLNDPVARANGLRELGREHAFTYAGHYLPHDVSVRELGNAGRHRFQALQALGVKPLFKCAAANPEDRVAAMRLLLPIMRFNRTPRVEVGLRHLRRYRKKFNELLGVFQGPLHDDHSHANDALGMFALNFRTTSTAMRQPEPPAPKPKPGMHYHVEEDGAVSMTGKLMEHIERKMRGERD